LYLPLANNVIYPNRHIHDLFPVLIAASWEKEKLMLWEHKLQANVSTAFSISLKLSQVIV